MALRLCLGQSHQLRWLRRCRAPASAGGVARQLLLPRPAAKPLSTVVFSKKLPKILERASGLGQEALQAELAGRTAAAAQQQQQQQGDQEQVMMASSAGQQQQDEKPPATLTGRFQDLPIVLPPDQHLNSAIKRTNTVKIDKGVKWKNAKLRDGRTKAKTLSAMKLDRMTKELASPMKTYVKGFPRVDRLHPFEKALLDLTIGVDHYQKVVARVDTSRKSILEIGKQYASKVGKSQNKKEAADVEEEGLKALEMLYTKGGPSLERLKQLAMALRRLPVVETSTPTVALVGAPNVGKSSLVQTLSSGTPEICDYPFTTRSIKMGHFYVDGRRHQVTDTPGLLQRSDEDRNAMEMLTVASLAYLPTSVIFVADLTEECGTTASNQWLIRKELRERFPSKPWVDVLSKADLLGDLLAEADSMPGLGPGEEAAVNTPLDLARAMREGLRVSSVTAEGIPELQTGVLHMVEEAYESGMLSSSPS